MLGVLLHLLVIAPLLGAAPINQLLATGGVLFFLQSAATVMFGVEFKNLGMRLPVLKLSGMFISYSRLLAFAFALGRHGAGLSVSDADLHRHRHPRHLPRTARSWC